MTTHKVAVVGLGSRGQAAAMAFSAQSALAAVCDIDPTQLTDAEARWPGVRRDPNYLALLQRDEISTIVLGTPIGTRATMAVEALKSGHNVGLLGPIHDEDEARAVASAAYTAKRSIWLLEPAHPVVPALLDAVPSLGQLRYLVIEHSSARGGRPSDPRGFSVSATDFALGVMIAGSPPDRVRADGSSVFHVGLADLTSVHVHFAGGLRARFDRSHLHFSPSWRCEITGDDGVLRFDGETLVRTTAEGAEILEVPTSDVSWLRLIEPALSTKANDDPKILIATATLLRRAHRSLDEDRPIEPGMDAPTPKVIDPDVMIHETAIVEGEVEIGAGTRVWHFSKLLGPLQIGERCSFGQNVVIERHVKIGDNVKIQNNVSVYSGVILEDDVFCGPSMVFTNVGTPRSHFPRRGEYLTTRVQKGASIGANATIVCGHTLGRYCFVGAGAVVTKDVPDYALVYGNPARVRAFSCFCGVTLPLSITRDGAEECQCRNCDRRYSRTGLTVVEVTP